MYSAAKAAVINLTRAASLQLAPDLIRVNAICPGGVLTPLTDRGNPAAVAKQMDKFQPWPEHGKPEHIASAALFLASDDSAFVTGEALVVDGGLTRRVRTYSEDLRGRKQRAPKPCSIRGARARKAPSVQCARYSLLGSAVGGIARS